ncbi:MAG: hypothetical protein LBO05_09345, partial [Deltaproteobacteria bacterium]|nr:hypothetical protein [Deltaproteobacteria bacterium]
MTLKPIKIFNTAGPCNILEHYMLPVLPRLPVVSKMIEANKYFILHAPRQSGKTTCLQFLTEKINRDNNYYAFKCSLASLRNVTDEDKGMNIVVAQINRAMEKSTVKAIKEKANAYNSLPAMAETCTKVQKILNQLCVDLDKNLVVFFDEADCLVGPSLICFLTQIRDGFIERYESIDSKFPQSLALVGMSNIRDYLTSNHPETEGYHQASPFNIVSERLTLANFTMEEIGNLYRQHTVATGQVFEDSAVERAWHWTEGQPWLVNALAHDVVSRQFGGDYSKVISDINIDQAAKTMILRNDTHLDSLLERLKEPRIRRVMEAVVAGIDSFPSEISDDDAKYTLDLGLLKKNLNRNDYQPANPIYQEVIVRALSSGLQDSFPAEYVKQASEFMNDNNLNMTGLLKIFQAYWRENSEIQTKNYEKDSLLTNSINQALQKYNITLNNIDIHKKLVYDIQKSLISLSTEALIHLVLHAFLQRVLNGGADFIQREYALGRLRADICVSYKKKRYPVE